MAAVHKHSARPRDAHLSDQRGHGATAKKRFCDNGYWGEYTGAVDARGLRHGFGTIVFEDGYQYSGEWKDDVPDGTGTGKYANGKNAYEGEWKDGAPVDKAPAHGHMAQDKTGGMQFVDGGIPGVYAGELSRGFRSGKGKMAYDNGTIYDGEWDAGKKSGWGEASYRNGSKYVGEWKAGSQHGWGTYTASDGGSYEGEWRFGSRDGRGTDRYADGSKFVGTFRANRRNGRGTFTWADGRVQIGNFKDDQEAGIGVRWNANRDKAWMFRNGRPHRGISLSEAMDIANRMGFSGIN
ncbi:hypothetical protein ACHAXT_000211 [Thalassiosira profunda]